VDGLIPEAKYSPAKIVHLASMPIALDFTQILGDSRKDSYVSLGAIYVRCAFFGRNLHSRMPLSFTPLLRLKRCHACDQWHSSRVSMFLTDSHCKLRPNAEGLRYDFV
jgi:hypothetical protein